MIDPPRFRRWKASELQLHEARKIGKARSLILGARFADPDLADAVAYIDAWLDRQPEGVRDAALEKPLPRTVSVLGSRMVDA